MKKNNNGFTLLETLIVSAFVAGTLTYLFIQINNAKTNYDITFRYDSINALYNTRNVAYYLREIGYNNLISRLTNEENGYVVVYNNDINSCQFISDITYCNNLMEQLEIKTVLFTSENLNKLNTVIKENKDIFFKDKKELTRYIKQLDYDIDNSSDLYRIIIEYEDNTFSSLEIG